MKAKTCCSPGIGLGSLSILEMLCLIEGLLDLWTNFLSLSGMVFAFQGGLLSRFLGFGTGWKIWGEAVVD